MNDNRICKQHGVEKLEDITPELLRKMVPALPDAREIEIVEKVLKRVSFGMGAGDYTLLADNKTGDRFVVFYGDRRYLKVNKSDRFDELDAREKEEKAERKRLREEKAALKAAQPVRVKRSVSSDGGTYPVDRSYTEVDTKQIKDGDILLLRHGNGTQLFIVDTSNPARLTLKGRRLRSRGTRWAGWDKVSDKPATISRNDDRILGLGRLVLGDPKP